MCLVLLTKLILWLSGQSSVPENFQLPRYLPGQRREVQRVKAPNITHAGNKTTAAPAACLPVDERLAKMFAIGVSQTALAGAVQLPRSRGRNASRKAAGNKVRACAGGCSNDNKEEDKREIGPMPRRQAIALGTATAAVGAGMRPAVAANEVTTTPHTTPYELSHSY